jgi:carnitine O-acetyltransferase
LIFREPAADPQNCTKNATLEPVQHLTWTIDDQIQASFSRAQNFIQKTIHDSDVELVHYDGYGSNFIKKVARVSPDAFSQMALQIAFFRMHKFCAPVYETSSTRKYLHGRTETCRSLTTAQKAFVETFDSANLTVI